MRRLARRWATRSSPTSASPWRRCLRRYRSPPARRPSPTRDRETFQITDPLNASTVHSAPRARSSPRTRSSSLSRPPATLALRNQLRLSRPGSYYFSAGGGLGFGLAASVGVQLAEPDRPVVCVLGEGSAQYAITAFWSAVAYGSRSPSWSCAMRSTGSSSGLPKSSGSKARRASTCRSSMSPRSQRATASSTHRVE